MTTEYRHTQIGYLILTTVGVAWLFAGVMLVVSFHWILLFVFILFTTCLALFPTLTVKVTATSVELWFGAGLLRETFPVAQIQSVQTVTNSPLYGWGIRPTLSGWLYNVSGLRGIELQLKNGRKCRIGTDEPEALAEAIRRSLAQPRAGQSVQL